MTGTATESAGLLQVHRDAGTWFARLNRPDKRNALSDALVAAIGVAGVGISARLSADDGLTQTARVSGPVVKASKSVVMTSSDQAVIR